MAMKPYRIDTFGKQHTWSKDSGSTVTNRRAYFRQLVSVASYKGDFHTPLAFSYNVKSVHEYHGSIRSYSLGHLVQSVDGYNNLGGFYAWESFIEPNYNESVRTQALSEAYDKLRGNVDLSVDLVQWRQTLQMISLKRRLVRGLASHAKKLVPEVDRLSRIERELGLIRGGGRRARRLTRELNSGLNQLAAMRLEYVYGWKPTASTIYELAKSAVEPRPGLLVCEGKGAARVTRRVSTPLDPMVPMVHTITTSDRCRVKLFFVPPAGVMTDLARISSLNPVSVLYEATPYSFIFDWMWDVGGWIRTLETAFLHRNDYVGGWTDQVQRTFVESQMVGNSYANTDAYRKGSFTEYAVSGSAIRTRRNRIPNTTAPWPLRPQKQFSLGSERLLNAISLAKVTLLDADRLLARRR